MRLHYAPGSAHCAAVRIALGEKGMEPELNRLDMVGYEQHSVSYLEINPHGTVPLLEHGGRKIFDSALILEYLEDWQPDPPLAGSDPRQRYGARKWGKYVETHIAPNLAIARWAALHGKVPISAEAGLDRLLPHRRTLWLQAARGFDRDLLAASAQAMLTAGERIAADLADRDWLCGDGFTFGDIAVYPHVAQFGALGLALPRAVDDWLARVAERPSLQAIKADLFPVATMGPEPGRWG